MWAVAGLLAAGYLWKSDSDNNVKLSKAKYRTMLDESNVKSRKIRDLDKQLKAKEVEIRKIEVKKESEKPKVEVVPEKVKEEIRKEIDKADEQIKKEVREEIEENTRELLGVPTIEEQIFE